MMTDYPAYPWQEQQWQQICQGLRQQRLPHAIVLSGAAGLGKLAFAEKCAALLLCDQPTIKPCGACEQCKLMHANTHPDFLLVAPEQKNHALKIDVIRQLCEQLQQSRHSAKRRVVIIADAHALTTAAANALLKTLEEPTLGNHIVLVCEQLTSLPATLLSRCQILHFPLASEKAIKVNYITRTAGATVDANLLATAYGAPLALLDELSAGIAAKRLAFYEILNRLTEHSPVQVAADFHDEGFAHLLEWLLVWVREQCQRTPVSAWFGLWDAIVIQKQQITRNINTQLTLECLLLQTQQVIGDLTHVR